MVLLHTELRENRGMYYFRCFQLFFAIVALGVAGNDVSNWHQSDCQSPATSNYNLAVPALLIPGLIYLLFSTGPATKHFTRLIWLASGQLAFDMLFLIFWLCAGAASAHKLSCSTMCGLCAAYGEDETYNGYYTVEDICYCYKGEPTSAVFKRELSKRASSNNVAAVKAFGKLSKKASKLGLDWFMFILFLISFIVTACSIYEARKELKAEETTSFESQTGTADKPSDHPLPPVSASPEMRRVSETHDEYVGPA